MQVQESSMDGISKQNQEWSFLKGQDIQKSFVKREEFHVNLRKGQRLEFQNKRRNIRYSDTVTDRNVYTQFCQNETNIFIATELIKINSNLGNPLLTPQQKFLELKSMIQQNWNKQLSANNHLESNFLCLQSVRKSISTDQEPNLSLVSQTGMIDIFIKYLDPTNPETFIYEAVWALTNQTSCESIFVEEIVSKGVLPAIFKLVNNSQNFQILQQCIWLLGNIAGDSIEYRDKVVAFGGIDVFVRILQYENQQSQLYKNTIWAISNIYRGKDKVDYYLIQSSISMVLSLTKSQDPQIQQDACWAISYVTESIEGTLQVSQSQELTGILNILDKQTKHEIISPALRIIGNLTQSMDNSITLKLLVNGLVPKLASLMNSSKWQIQRETLWILSNIAAGSYDQIQYLFDLNVYSDVFTLLHSNSELVAKEAAYVILNTLQGANEIQMEYFSQSLIIDELIKCLNNNSRNILLLILDCIQSILEFGRTQQNDNQQNINMMMDMFEQKDGMVKIEDLLTSSDSSIYNKVEYILSEYFGVSDHQCEYEAQLQIPSQGFSF